jgi:hypothetical protein
MALHQFAKAANDTRNTILASMNLPGSDIIADLAEHSP